MAAAAAAEQVGILAQVARGAIPKEALQLVAAEAAVVDLVQCTTL